MVHFRCVTKQVSKLEAICSYASKREAEYDAKNGPTIRMTKGVYEILASVAEFAHCEILHQANHCCPTGARHSHIDY